MRFIQLLLTLIILGGASFAQDYDCEKMAGNYWMAQNLDMELPGSWCYEDDPANCEKFGRLYTYEAALEACPEGWRLPRFSEWKQLITYYGKDDLEKGEEPAFNLRWGGMRRAMSEDHYYAKGKGTKFWIDKGYLKEVKEDSFQTSVIGAWKDSELLDVSYEEIDAKETGYYVRCVKE